MVQTRLTSADWTRVVLVAGIGTILEWTDFYIFAQLSPLLKKIFFAKGNPTAQTLSWWAVYAVGFVVRPLGALIFGTIGDLHGRNTTLRIAIVCMAIPTVLISILPTYDVGPYTAGIVAPVLLTILRLLQGLAMGGEFGPAIIYISELAPVTWRGRLVAVMQMAVNVGMFIATLLVMLLENTVSDYGMQVWGWRIPFALASVTALLGYYLRAGLPEPKTFLAAARAEKEAEAKAAMADGEAVEGVHAVPSAKSISSKADDATTSDNDMAEERFDAPEEEGALTRLHGHHTSKLPLIRLLMNNWMGLGVHILYMAWVSAAFYATVTWLPAQLRDAGLKPIITQGILVVSMITNALGLFACGTFFDKGGRSIYMNLAVTVIGMSTAFGFYRGMWYQDAALDVNSLAAWFLIPGFQFVVGIAMASVVLPTTRIYGPLERTTGFSFGYNCGYGVIGGFTPFAVSAIIDSLGADNKAYAPSFWMLGLGGASLLGCWLMRLYAPRLNKKFVGRIE